jgi:hypothetical protein
MAVIITPKRRHALQEGGLNRSLRLKGVFPGIFPSSIFLFKLFQLNRQIERKAFS